MSLLIDPFTNHFPSPWMNYIDWGSVQMHHPISSKPHSMFTILSKVLVKIQPVLPFCKFNDRCLVPVSLEPAVASFCLPSFLYVFFCCFHDTTNSSSAFCSNHFLGCFPLASSCFFPLESSTPNCPLSSRLSPREKWFPPMGPNPMSAPVDGMPHVISGTTYFTHLHLDIPPLFQKSPDAYIPLLLLPWTNISRNGTGNHPYD